MIALSDELLLNQNLPGPLERPGADQVIYDAYCPLCRQRVWRLARLDTQRRLSFIASDDSLAESLLKQEGRRHQSVPLMIVRRNGQRLTGAAAARFLSRRLRRCWWSVPLTHLPGGVWLVNRLRQWANRWRFDPVIHCTFCREHA